MGHAYLKNSYSTWDVDDPQPDVIPWFGLVWLGLHCRFGGDIPSALFREALALIQCIDGAQFTAN